VETAGSETEEVPEVSTLVAGVEALSLLIFFFSPSRAAVMRRGGGRFEG